MQIKKILSTLNYEKQMFLKLLMLVTIPILVMGMVSYNIYISAQNANSQLTLESYSTEISREYNTILTSIKEYYIETVNSDTFRWLLHQDEVPYSRYTSLKKAQRDLEGNSFIHNYIEGYNFINLDHGWIFNNYGLFPYEKLENKEETERFLAGQKMVNATVYWINRSEVAPPMTENGLRLSNSVDSSGFSLIIKNQRDDGGLAWILGIKLDTRSWRELSESYKKAGYDIAVLGGLNHSVLLETNPDMTETYYEHEEEGSGIYKGSKAGKYRIQVKEDVSNNMTYVVGYNTAKVKADAAMFLFASLVVVLGFGILFFVLRLAAVAFAKPLYMMQKHVDDQKTQIKELLVSNLIKGELNQSRIEEALKKSDVTPFPCYRMMAMKYKEESEETAREKYSKVLNEFPENLRNQVFITPIYYREKLVFLIGAENEQDIDIKTAVLYKESKDFMEYTGQCATASGISRIFHVLDQVRQAYSECTEALYNKTNKEDMQVASLVLFDDYATMNHGSNMYDRIMETELIQMIESCKGEDAVRLLELILDRMETKGVVGIERNFYLTRLLTAVMNIPETAGIPLSDVFGSEQYNVLNQLTQIYEKSRLLKAVKEQMILPIISKIEEKEQKGNESEIVRQALELIRTSKGNISLNECADQLSYHPNYLSKVLKREKGETFTEIVNEEKMKQAKYMLLTTEYSVAEISEKLQYTNVQNFIRFFKNHEGVTPAAFRKERRS